MSLFSSIAKRFSRSDDWKQAEGVLPVERALADEHEAMHGESLTAALEAITVDFDASQFVDIHAFARDLRDAIGPTDSGIPVAENLHTRSEQEFTPRDAIGQLLLHDATLRTALEAYEQASEATRSPAGAAFAVALAARFNALLDRRLMDEEIFKPFLEAGAVDALGDAPAGATAATEHALLLRRANRELLEAAFPHEVAQMRDRRLGIVFDAARRSDTAALCLSGGGIRSSTFALGVMQGLARHRLLGKFDYLSTVSGGGLSGGWLSAWMRRSGAKAVHEALRVPGREKVEPEPEPVQGLRAFSHWLTPRAGAWSVDSWTVIATVVRNLLLNWMVLLPLLAGLVMLPRLMVAVLALDYGPAKTYEVTAIASGMAIGLLCILGSAAYLEVVRARGNDDGTGKRGAPSQGRVLAFFLLPRVIGSVIVSLTVYVGNAWDLSRTDTTVGDTMFTTLASILFIAMMGVVVMSMVRRGARSILQALRRGLKAVVSGVIGYLLPIGIIASLDLSRPVFATIAPVILLLGSVVASQLYSGLTSDEASDAEREWAARANAWILIVAIAWMTASGMVLLGPHLMDSLWQKLTVLGVGGVSSWLTVALSKRSPDSSAGKPSLADSASKAALSLAMPAVVACLVIGLAAANDGTLDLICQTTDTIASAMQCSPPSDDSTSVPLLTYIASAKQVVAVRTGDALKAQLGAASVVMPRSVAESTAMAASDAILISASRDRTMAVLAFDSAAVRLIRRAGEATFIDVDAVDDSSSKVLKAFRDFTAKRTASLPLRFGDEIEHPSVLPGVELMLATDTALKAGLVARGKDHQALIALLDSAQNAKTHHQPSDHALWVGVLALLAAMMVSGLFFSTMVNTNTFSLHAMWKARTVRSFLGTTRAAVARNPNPFTGFDSDDDVPLRDLWPSRVSPIETAHAGERSEMVPPMHVLNVTLNLAAGRNLAWQQRKGESMTLTPLHAGSAFTGYRPMEARTRAGAVPRGMRVPGYGGDAGVSLGTAMAISGAAASPNDGAGTTALGSFLMTFLNARLGWWLGNPGAPGADTWQRSAPKQRLTPILSEMFGLTSDRSQYVYLSDGGHFENLAMYEMVFRRCRFIVVSDAGADPDYSFEDLGNAVRKIRVDFGIPIDFDSPVKVKSGDNTAGAYWATARIRYSAIDMPKDGNPDDYDGVLVYLKPAVYGVEPRDVVNYANLSPTFPQESSADQFFSESQFESYRALGSWIVDQLVANPSAPGAPVVVASHRDGSLLSSWPKLGTP